MRMTFDIVYIVRYIFALSDQLCNKTGKKNYCLSDLRGKN